MRFLALWAAWSVVGCSGDDGALFGQPAEVQSGTGGAVAAASTGGAPGTGGASCAGGDTRECVGPGACRGAQACDGSGWSACDCGSATGGVNGAGGVVWTGGASATGGIADSGVPSGSGGHVPGTPPCEMGWTECSGVCVLSGTPCGTGGAASSGGTGGACQYGSRACDPGGTCTVLDTSTGCGESNCRECSYLHTRPPYSEFWCNTATFIGCDWRCLPGFTRTTYNNVTFCGADTATTCVDTVGKATACYPSASCPKPCCKSNNAGLPPCGCMGESDSICR